MAETQAHNLEPEADDYDSSLETGTINDSTVSISSSILKYRQENGRTYHAYKDGAYAFPNDEKEKDRLDFQHHQWALTFEGKLNLAPIPKEKQLHRVLDIGCGTGIWSIDFGEAHPESEVIGVDLSPIQPSFVPPNVSFQVDDVEAEWTFSNKFDFIYSRMMVGSLADTPKFVKQCFDNLTPGGYLEMVDLTYPTRILGNKWPEGSALKQWSDLCMEALNKFGRKPEVATFYKQYLEEAGFVDVVQEKFIWPTNRWPKDKKLKEIGMWQLENLGGGLEAISMALFTRALQWEAQEVDIFLARVRSELKNTKIHSYWDIYAVYGKKPEVN